MRDDQPNLLISREIRKIVSSGYERKVCKLKYGDKNGTGFLCIIPSNRMKALLTCNHLLDEIFVDKCKKNIKEEKEKTLELYFEIDTIINTIKINLNIDRYIFTDQILDFTLIEILDEINIDDFLEVDENYNIKQYINEQIYVPQFTEDNENLDLSLGRINRFEWPYFLSDDNLKTSEGSSGSPIILKENNKVIGIHLGSKNKKIKK